MVRETFMKSNETGKKHKRFFAITSLGTTRWYWVVWPSLDEVQASIKPLLHIAEGYEKTKAEAVEKALEAAGRFATWISAKYAKAYHRTTMAGTSTKGDQPERKGSPDLPLFHEFLYRDVYDSTNKQWKSVPHRVVRRTNKYVFVEQYPYSPDDFSGSWLDSERSTYRLDRQALEQNGYAFIPASADLADQEEPLFFNYERKMRQGNQLPKCLEVLRLSWPCTLREVQEAYRSLVKSAHPDGGGSHDKFLELQTAYEQALRMCR